MVLPTTRAPTFSRLLLKPLLPLVRDKRLDVLFTKRYEDMSPINHSLKPLKCVARRWTNGSALRPQTSISYNYC